MYGKPLMPNKCTFAFYNDGEDAQDDIRDDSFSIFIKDDEDTSNDDIRDILHPDWELLWENDMENLFSPQRDSENWEDIDPSLSALNTIDKARKWLLSIGMTEVNKF